MPELRTNTKIYPAHTAAQARGMMYLTSGSSSMAAAVGAVGSMCGPRQGGMQPMLEGRLWAADNDAFSGNFEERAFTRHLSRMTPYAQTCLFFVAPDVIEDRNGTEGLFEQWGTRIREAGYPVAWVAHDGVRPGDIPDCDCVFIGGSTPWKLSSAAHAVCRAARTRGLWVHMGKVNSQKRTVSAAKMGAQSVDGTHRKHTSEAIAFGHFAAWTGAARPYAQTLPLMLDLAS